MTTTEEWVSDDDEEATTSESIADRAMRLAAHAVTVAAFWNAVGPTSTTENIEALVAAYRLGDPEQFASVMCEVTTDSALEIVRAFVQRVSA